MSKQADHSKTPWHVGRASDENYMGDLPAGSLYIEVADGSRQVVCEFDSCDVPEAEESLRRDADFIVRAVNAHEAMKAALAAYTRWNTVMGFTLPTNLMRDAEAALVLAEGE